MIRRASLITSFFLALAVTPGCSTSPDTCTDDTSSKLGGSSKETFQLSCSYVDIFRQEHQGEFVAMKVMYVDLVSAGTKRWPVILVAKAPIEEGVPRDLVKDGSVTRTYDQSDFPDIELGNITFEKLGGVGETAEGNFAVTFVTGTTLNGEFSGKVQPL